MQTRSEVSFLSGCQVNISKFIIKPTCVSDFLTIRECQFALYSLSSSEFKINLITFAKNKAVKFWPKTALKININEKKKKKKSNNKYSRNSCIILESSNCVFILSFTC